VTERTEDALAAGVRELIARGAPPETVVLVHDGARPAVDGALIGRVFEAAAAHGAAVPVLPVVDTLKRLDGDRVLETVDRSGLAAVQTPQGIRLELLRAALERYPPDGPVSFTDEASLLEACTIPVHVVPGSLDNLKVTYPVDRHRVTQVLNVRSGRVGYGEDMHPFGPGEPLALGGIEVPGAPRLHGHSDGDVVLHAIANALLSAAGLGDLGRHAPADARTPEGVASADLLIDVVARLRGAGFDPVRVDVTIVGARPRLAPWLEGMARRVAELASLAPDAVSIQASTGNLMGTEGAGRGIAARAVATVESTEPLGWRDEADA